MCGFEPALTVCKVLTTIVCFLQTVIRFLGSQSFNRCLTAFSKCSNSKSSFWSRLATTYAQYIGTPRAGLWGGACARKQFPAHHRHSRFALEPPLIASAINQRVVHYCSSRRKDPRGHHQSIATTSRNRNSNTFATLLPHHQNRTQRGGQRHAEPCQKRRDRARSREVAVVAVLVTTLTKANSRCGSCR